MIARTLAQLPPEDAVAVLGSATARLRLAGAADDDAWTIAFARHLAGELSWDEILNDLLGRGRHWEAIKAIATTDFSEGRPSAKTYAEIARAWGLLVEEYNRTLEAIDDSLEGLHSPLVVELAEEFRKRREGLRWPMSRPESLEEAQWAEDTLRETKSLLDEVRAANALEAEERVRRHRESYRWAKAAWERLLDAVADESQSNRGHAVTLLRELPELYLRGNSDALKRIAERDTPIETIQPQAGGAAFSWIQAPVQDQGVIDDGSFREAVAALSAYSKHMLDRAAGQGAALSNLEQLNQVDEDLARKSLEQQRDAWLAIAKATELQAFRAFAMARGLASEGLRALQLRTYASSGYYLRDAFSMMCLSGSMGEEHLHDMAVYLVAAKAWRHVGATSALQKGLDVASWLADPASLFSWIRRNGQLSLIAIEWREFLDEEAARMFLDICTVHTSSQRELYRACASMLLQPARVRFKAGAVFQRLQALFPGEECQTVRKELDRLADELGTTAQERTSGGARSTLHLLLHDTVAALEKLPQDTISPVGAVIEALTQIVEDSAGPVGDGDPKITVQPIVREFYPEERRSEVEFPVLVRNAEGAGHAFDLTVEISLEEATAPGRPVIEEPQNRIQELAPGSEETVRFLIGFAETLELSERRFRVDVRWQGGHSRQGFSVAIRPGTRSLLASPYSTGLAVKSDSFVGRQKELNQLIAALAGPSEPRTVLVYGIRRIGKTSLLKRAIVDPEIERRYYVAFWSLDDRPDSDTTSEFMVDLCKRIRDALPESLHTNVDFVREEIREAPYTKFEDFLASIRRLQLKKRVLLVMDEFDRLFTLIQQTEERQGREGRPLRPDEAIQREILGALRKAVMDGDVLALVMAGLPRLMRQHYQDRFFGMLEDIHLGPISKRDADEIIDEGKPLKKTDTRARREIYDLTGLHPYLLQLVCHNLFVRMIYSGRDIVAPFDVEETINEKILPNESTFLDYRSLIGEDEEVLWGLSLALRDVKTRRAYASVREVADQLAGRGRQYTTAEIQERFERLRADATVRTADERPLVLRSPSNANKYRLAVGLIGEHLIRRHEVGL
jgi:hypothetical protein